MVLPYIHGPTNITKLLAELLNTEVSVTYEIWSVDKLGTCFIEMRSNRGMTSFDITSGCQGMMPQLHCGSGATHEVYQTSYLCGRRTTAGGLKEVYPVAIYLLTAFPATYCLTVHSQKIPTIQDG